MASTIKVNNIQNQCGANIINESANTITIGASGDTISLAAGASQTGFGRTGTVDWDTTAKTTSFTAVSGNGYFVNTTSGAITVTMPSTPSAGDIVSLSDYAGTWDTNNVTLSSANYDGTTGTPTLSTKNQTATFIYVDGTKGWLVTTSSTTRVSGFAPLTATGGTITTCGDYKIHTFTSPGTFCVSSLGNTPTGDRVEYLVVAGGGGGGAKSGCGNEAGGGGGGGFRESDGTVTGGCYSVSPIAAPAGALTVTATAYPVTIGAGGASSTNGNNSIFSTIISAGGGAGGDTGGDPGSPGGSGGGGGYGPHPGGGGPGGTGNTPPVSPPQGNPGFGSGSAGPSSRNGGGGGAGGAGGPGGAAGPGATTSITGSATTYSAGASQQPTINNGADNTGDAGQGINSGPATPGSSGGSGIVVIRYKYQ